MRRNMGLRHFRSPWTLCSAGEERFP